MLLKMHNYLPPQPCVFGPLSKFQDVLCYRGDRQSKKSSICYVFRNHVRFSVGFSQQLLVVTVRYWTALAVVFGTMFIGSRADISGS